MNKQQDLGGDFFLFVFSFFLLFSFWQVTFPNLNGPSDDIESEMCDDRSTLGVSDPQHWAQIVNY